MSNEELQLAVMDDDGWGSAITTSPAERDRDARKAERVLVSAS